MQTKRPVARTTTRLASGLLLAVAVVSCATDAPPTAADRQAVACQKAGEAALSSCSKPKQSPAYYVDQAQRYFDALDTNAPADRVPVYAELAARWEWPPWLKLTGYTAEQLETTDKADQRLRHLRRVHLQ